MKTASIIPLVLSGALLIVVHLHADDDEATKNNSPVEVYADCHVHLLDFLQKRRISECGPQIPGGQIRRTVCDGALCLITVWRTVAEN